MAHEYAVVACADEVEAWSTRRLPFEPKGWLVGLRADLRQGLGQLAVGDDVLEGIYTSPVREACDIENVLFYNVGSAFASSTQRGIRFERSFDTPPAPPQPLAAAALHHHVYRPARAGSPFTHWTEGPTLVRFADVPLPRLSPETKPAAIWAALHGADAQAQATAAAPEALAIRLALVMPTGTPAASALVKPLLDGVVSAFHAHDGSAVDDVSARVAAQLNRPAAEVAQLLQARDRAVLGVRRLLHVRGEGVQWSPADDLCVACEITLERSASATTPFVSGRVAEARTA